MFGVLHLRLESFFLPFLHKCCTLCLHLFFPSLFILSVNRLNAHRLEMCLFHDVMHTCLAFSFFLTIQRKNRIRSGMWRILCFFFTFLWSNTAIHPSSLSNTYQTFHRLATQLHRISHRIKSYFNEYIFFFNFRSTDFFF